VLNDPNTLILTEQVLPSSPGATACPAPPAIGPPKAMLPMNPWLPIRDRIAPLLLSINDGIAPIGHDLLFVRTVAIATHISLLLEESRICEDL
jgi:hypothetical protein